MTDDPAAAGPPVIETDPPLPDLRAWRRGTTRGHVVFLANEGEHELAARAWLRPAGRVERWDPLTGEVSPVGAVVEGDRVRFELRLERRQGVALAVDPAGAPEPPRPDAVWRETARLEQWEWRPGAEWRPAGLGDWCAQRELETFAGTIPYRTSFTTAEPGDYRLDLGAVDELARVWFNGQVVGSRLWAPYRFDLGRLEPGHNLLLVEVTNSIANRMTGALRPSGLAGPVSLWRAEPGAQPR